LRASRHSGGLNQRPPGNSKAIRALMMEPAPS
jgi:hypothetical protein